MIKVLFENAPLGFSPGHNLPPGSRLKRLMRRRLRVITDANRSSSEPGDGGGTENPGVGGSIPSQPTIHFRVDSYLHAGDFQHLACRTFRLGRNLADHARLGASLIGMTVRSAG